MNSKYGLEFKQDMSKKQVVNKLIKKYALSKKDIKILKIDITVEGKKK